MKKRYEIKKSINNNISFSVDDDGNEIVIFGKGISFGKKPGDYVDASQIDKKYVLASKRQKSMFDEMIDSIPLEYVELANDIVRMYEEEFKIAVNTIMIMTLADHLYNAVSNKREGIDTPNDMVSEIRRLYAREFALGRKALDDVERVTGVRLTDNEVAFIVLHYINSTSSKPRSDAVKRVQMVNKIVNMVESYFDITLNQESYHYDRFITHLTYFASRVFSGEDIKMNDDFVYRMIKIQYPDVSKCVDIIEEVIQEDYGKRISNEEKGYLIIHINGLLKSNK